MKLSEFLNELDAVVAKYHLQKDNVQLMFDASCTIEGTTSYIPTKYTSGTYYDPPEAFAKEYKFKREVEAVATGYMIGKNGSKCILAVDFFEEGPEGRVYNGGEEWDGSLSSIKASIEKLGLVGNEEVVVNYDGKDYQIVPSSRSGASHPLVSSIEKDKYGSYDIIWLNAPFEPSIEWQEWKADEIADNIDPEDEIMQSREDWQ